MKLRTWPSPLVHVGVGASCVDFATEEADSCQFPKALWCVGSFASGCCMMPRISIFSATYDNRQTRTKWHKRCYTSPRPLGGGSMSQALATRETVVSPPNRERALKILSKSIYKE